ncbi:MAG: glucose-6-phosphate isomerase, partial [Aquidulcibacter sp.]
MTYKDFIARGQLAASVSLSTLLLDLARHKRLNFQCAGLHFDFSRALLSQTDLDALILHAQEIGVEQARSDLFAGKAINVTEDRAVMHMALRQPDRDFMAKGEAVSAA